MLEKRTLFSLDDVTIIPAVTTTVNTRTECCPKYHQRISGEGGDAYPIITAPMDSVVDENNFMSFYVNGIETILPRTVELEKRLIGCRKQFCAFSINEILLSLENDTLKLGGPGDKLMILIDIANGHMISELELGRSLKKQFGNQLVLMGGNIGHPLTYFDYEDAGFDFVRVGIGGGEGCITSSNLGLHYGMASLLDDISLLKQERGGDYHCKIIADGGIHSFADITKSLALGADYVMMGYTLAQALEASGDIYIQETEDSEPIQIDKSSVSEINLDDHYDIFKEYHGMSTKEAQAKMAGKVLTKDNRKEFKTAEGRTLRVKIKYTIGGWCENFDSFFRSLMSYTDSRSIDEFKRKAVCTLWSDSCREKITKK